MVKFYRRKREADCDLRLFDFEAFGGFGKEVRSTLREAANQLSNKLSHAHSSAGNLSAAPADIPGSPNYVDASDPARQERLRRRLTVFKVGGTFLGDGDACASALLELMRVKLEKPLSYIVRMRGSGRVRHARLLQLQLVRLCACSIPNHWMRTMPPTQTEGAAAFADEATGAAAALILDFGRSPD